MQEKQKLLVKISPPNMFGSCSWWTLHISILETFGNISTACTFALYIRIYIYIHI
jgi:hypothetical protein